MAKGEAGEPIRRAMAEAADQDINATPTLLVNGNWISGALDYQRVSAAVNEALYGRADIR
jgi:predicted DsbA family dithiol-disulfide isomerase